MNRRESREENNYFVLFTQNLTIQKVTSTMLRILIPVKRPRIPPERQLQVDNIKSLTLINYQMLRVYQRRKVSWT